MTDVFPLLERFKWRGQEYPLLARSVSFAHEGAPSRIQYRDNEFIEQLGAHSLTFSYTIPAREDIAKGPYRALFREGYYRLFRDMRNRDPGELVDPFLGTFQCVPTRFDDEPDVNKRDGTDLRLEFTHSPDQSGQEYEPAPALGGLATDAGALDAELQKVDWEQEPSPEPTVDPIDAITGVGAQVENNVGKVSAALDDFAYKCEKVEQQIDRLDNGSAAWPLQRALRRNRYNAKQAKKRLGTDPTKKVITVTNSYGRPFSVVANEAQMDLMAFIELNPALLALPFVPAGALIQIVKRRG
jgi:hypothetical protein